MNEYGMTGYGREAGVGCIIRCPPLASTETPISGLKGEEYGANYPSPWLRHRSGSAHSLWTTVGYAEKVRTQFLSLRQIIPGGLFSGRTG
jgi:hypothetical protein